MQQKGRRKWEPRVRDVQTAERGIVGAAQRLCGALGSTTGSIFCGDGASMYAVRVPLGRCRGGGRPVACACRRVHKSVRMNVGSAWEATIDGRWLADGETCQKMLRSDKSEWAV